MKTRLIYIFAILSATLACAVGQPTPPPATDAPVSPPTVIIVVTNTPDAPPASATPEPVQEQDQVAKKAPV